VLPVVEAVVVLSVVLSDLRFMVGRSGSSAGVLPEVFVDPEFALVVVPVDAVVLSLVPLSDRRFIVGRSGSSAGVLDVEAVLVLSAVLSDLRFMVGRSGSSVELFGGVVDAAPGLLSSPEVRRFMVGRSGSLLDVSVVPVPLPVSELVLLWPAVVAGVSLEGFVCSWG
jgi:hypothetical protein